MKNNFIDNNIRINPGISKPRTQQPINNTGSSFSEILNKQINTL